MLATALSVPEGYSAEDLTSRLSMQPGAIAISRAGSAEFGGAYSIVCKMELLSTNDKAGWNAIDLRLVGWTVSILAN